MNLIRSFFIAFSMYSKIPMPRTEWTKEAMKYSLCFFPLVGGVIGGLVLFWGKVAGGLKGSLLFPAVLAVIPVLVTGGIHLDGLLDTADALSSYKSKEEKLEILKDSHAGAFAIIVGISYFILYLGICSEAGTESLKILAVGYVLSRALSGFAMVSFPMAKNTGLAVTFSDMAVKNRVRAVMLLYSAACCSMMVWLNPLPGAMAVLGAVLSFGYYRWMSGKIFGGITGDLAGFFLQVCELVIAACVIGTEICGR